MFVSGQKPNQFTYSHSQPHREHEIVCSDQPTLEGEHWRLLSTAPCTIQDTTPSTFVEVLHSWGNMWLWEHMSVYGGVIWLEQTIPHSTLVTVTDGLYIREFYPPLYSAAFIIECTKGCGRVVGSFSKLLSVANAYRGELLGLMAIHLILLSANKIHQSLVGSVEIVSDCLGALKQVTHLPQYWIPSWCHHLDILKTILVHCQGLLFTTYYSHIRAHQDNNVIFSKLRRKAQLNCICNHTAKQQIAAVGMEAAMLGRIFLLEPISLLVCGQKITSETGGHIRY